MNSESAQTVVIGSGGEGKSAALEIIYDADVVQRVPYGGIIAVVKPYSDTLFAENRKKFVEVINQSLKRDDEAVITQEEIKQALLRDNELADQLIETIEGYPDLPADWKELMAVEDKQAIIQKALNFVIDEDEKQFAIGQLIVLTACYFNGKVANQKHVLRKVTIDDSSAYNLLVSKQYKPIKGKKFGQKDALEFVAQDDAKAALYDSMVQSVEGFAQSKVPLRVKILVIDHIFTPLNGKK